MLNAVARFVTARSRLVIGIWIALVVALAVEGRGIERELIVHPIFVDGTASKRAHEVAQREFGNDYSMVVLLRGPEDEVEEQGRALARGIDAQPGMLVASPWAGGAAVRGLAPRPGVATIVVRFEDEDPAAALDPVNEQVDALVRAPVEASVAGLPVVIDSIRNSSEHASTVGELIAIPTLLIVLLIVFRSVLAALMPVLVGGAVVAATRGILSTFHGLVEIDIFALGVAAMMGLALGVDYSLLAVSRFREERAGKDLADAVGATVVATARSIVPAGCALLLAMAVAALLLPSTTVTSVALAVGVATVLSMLSAICVTPALLTLLDANLDRWSLSRRPAGTAAPLLWSRRLADRPRAVIATIVLLVFLAGYAFSLDSGAASVALLPPDDPGRQQQEEVEEALGPGWAAPIEVVVDGGDRSLTSRRRLAELAAFQNRVERDPGVASVTGLKPVARVAEQSGEVETELAKQERALDKLEWGIARLRGATVLNTEGLRKAADGSSRLGSGISAANKGAGALAEALEETSSGSSRLADGLGQADEGSDKLAEGTTKASGGASRLAEGLEKAQKGTGDISSTARLLQRAMRSGSERLDEARRPLTEGEARLAAALAALQRMTTGQGDPEYAAALQAVEEASAQLSGVDPRSGEPTGSAGVGTGLERAEGQFGVGDYLASRLDRSGEQASEGIGKLSRGAQKLDEALSRLADGSRRVSRGVAALADGGEQLPPALRKLSDGAGRLETGLGLLESGAGRLAGGLGEGAEESGGLTDGLDKIGGGLEGRGDSDLARLRERSPGLFDSSYFVLAGLDGSQPRPRRQLTFLLNLNRGGTVARILVIPRDEPTSDAAHETVDRVEAEADELADLTRAEVLVGGVTPGEIDANEELRDQTVPLRIALSLISLLILIPVLRSLTVPLLAALINLLVVSATFGVMALLFNDSLLGGPGYVDAAIIPATVMMMFGLAIDYEVFVFARIREEYLRTGSTRAAVANGLDRTGHVVTGAAVIMISIFLAFSISEFVSGRNFGVALAVAVFIDAFFVRLVVVPAMMNWLGEWCWWLPRPLRRRRS